MPQIRRYQAEIIGLVVIAVLLTSCGADSPRSGVVTTGGRTAGGNLQALPAHTPVAVPGVEPCDVLPQQRAVSTTTDGLPALQLPCLTPGPTIGLSELRGRPVLINLWASWCGPCRAEMPLLQENYARHGTDVQFLGVSTRDTVEPAKAFLTDVGVTYPQVVDTEGELLNDLRVPGLPITVIVDSDGRIAGRHIGELDQDAIDDLYASVSADVG